MQVYFMSLKKYTGDEDIYWQILLLIKQIEDLYALSSGLTKRRRQYVRDRFKRIWKKR